MASHRLLQANINHSSRAQDLLAQTMAEWNIELAIVAEPYAVPSVDARWRGDTAGLVAIVSGGNDAGASLVPGERGKGYVACLWDGWVFVGGLRVPQHLTRGLRVQVGRDWGGRPLAAPRCKLGRGRERLQCKVRGLGLGHEGRDVGGLIRRARPPHRQPGVRANLHVSARELNSGCDPRFGGGLPGDKQVDGLGRGDPLRPQALRLLDADLAYAAAIAKSWEEPPAEGQGDMEAEAAWFGEALSQICNAAMPCRRSSPREGKKAVHWWTLEIAALCESCNSARRRYTRHRRRRRNPDRETAATLYETYRAYKKSLQAAIAEAKANAWGEFLNTLDGDPWGRPYRLVRNKLRPASPPTTETLDPGLLRNVTSALFPGNDKEVDRARDPAAIETRIACDEGLKVSREEFDRAIEKMKKKNTAPGPDGIPEKVCAIALRALGDRLRQLFDRCLQSGRFPTPWKEARLVLIPKAGRPAGDPSANRPICLLADVGKLLERIVGSRLTCNLESGTPAYRPTSSGSVLGDQPSELFGG
ncbi:uncharacterized protein LOC105200607 [Solenopsis invicta]|uniref:uncharacterized protein LOC105200607 n=1 Tax=Solenopsis invicta TaxID=13686 RepID=UPI00059610E5|nr:uncharacterized protein LOC105200607 [Solenopsis invicta]